MVSKPKMRPTVLLTALLLSAASACTWFNARSKNAPSKLYVLDDSKVSKAELLTLHSLSGYISRLDAPLVYFLSANPSDYNVWLDEMSADGGIVLDYSYFSSPLQVLPTLIAVASGLSASLPLSLATFTDDGDDSSTSALESLTYSLALTYSAGSESTIVASTDLAATLQLPVAYSSVTSVPESSRQIITDLFLPLLSDPELSFSESSIVFQAPGAMPYLSDYAVFSKSPYLPFDYLSGSPAITVSAFLDRYTANPETAGCSAAYGWFPDEGTYVSTLSKHGIAAIASDWAKNLPALSSSRTPPGTAADASAEPTAKRPAPSAQGSAAAAPPSSHSVLFVMSDGDNLQWLLNGFSGAEWYGDPDRASVPLAFTLAPTLRDVAPAAYDRIVGNKGTAGTSFVCAPSGAGYLYPLSLPSASTFSSYAAATLSLLPGNAGMRVVNVIGSPGDDDNIDHDLLTSVGSPFLDGEMGADAVIYYSYGGGYSLGGGRVAWTDGGRAVFTARFSLWGSSDDYGQTSMLGNDGLVAALNAQSRDATSSLGYSIVTVHAWSHSAADVKYVIDRLDEGVEALTTEEFVERFYKYVNKSSSDDWGDDGVNTDADAAGLWGGAAAFIVGGIVGVLYFFRKEHVAKESAVQMLLTKKASEVA